MPSVSIDRSIVEFECLQSIGTAQHELLDVLERACARGDFRKARKLAEDIGCWQLSSFIVAHGLIKCWALEKGKDKEAERAAYTMEYWKPVWQRSPERRF